jgi:predicted ATPase
LGSQSQLELEQKWDEITTAIMDKSTVSVGMESIPVMFGRELQVPESCNGVARFTFEQVCDRPVGAADYIALAQNYHTVFITDIPIMSMRIHDKARRFITLVDELYNHRCRLICTADAPPDDLFLGTLDGPILDLESLQFETEAESSRLRRDVQAEGSVAPLGVSKEGKASIHSLLSGREELFAFRRAVSRLMEMQTPVYLKMINCHPKFQEETIVSSAGG